MAGGAIVNTGGGKDYPGKLTLFVLLTCIVAATGGLIFGYDIGISGGVTSMDPFLKKFFPEVFRRSRRPRPTSTASTTTSCCRPSPPHSTSPHLLPPSSPTTSPVGAAAIN